MLWSTASLHAAFSGSLCVRQEKDKKGFFGGSKGGTGSAGKKGKDADDDDDDDDRPRPKPKVRARACV
jgi:hypothetical protein